MELSMLPIDGTNALWVDNEYLLLDNMESPGMVSMLPAEFHFPMKVFFNIGLLCVSGHFRMQLNLADYTVEAGQAFVAQRNSIGQCLEFSDDCRIMMLAVAGEEIGVGFPPRLVSILRQGLIKSPVFNLGDDFVASYHDVYQRIRQRLADPAYPLKREFIEAALSVQICDVCSVILRTSAERPPSASSRKEQIFSRFTELVTQHYATERSIKWYADQLFLTPKYLSQVVHQVSGRLAGDWIRDYVILEAKALIKSRKYSIQQVSDQLNFPNQSFFATYFRKAVGCSPKSYQDG